LKFACILVAAGRGRRARSAANKVLVRAGNIPIFQYSLKRFAGLDECEQIVLVASPRNMEQGFFDKKRR
jgi:2-C-methyl-D-erythritol 4-phosphate cytidylyltransferase